LKDLSFINIFIPGGSTPFVVYSHARKKTYFSSLEGTRPMFLFIRTIPIARYGDNAVVFEVSPWHLFMNREPLYEYFGQHYKSFLDDLYSGLDKESNSILLICHLNKDI